VYVFLFARDTIPITNSSTSAQLRFSVNCDMYMYGLEHLGFYNLKHGAGVVQWWKWHAFNFLVRVSKEHQELINKASEGRSFAHYTLLHSFSVKTSMSYLKRDHSYLYSTLHHNLCSLRIGISIKLS